MTDDKLELLALNVAWEAHKMHFDKAGEPYILHVVRVYMEVPSPNTRVVALLHDVVEDTDVTMSMLELMGFPEHILVAIDAITRKSGEEYKTYIKRSASNIIARTVKIADVQDNLRVERMAVLSDKDATRLKKKYNLALQIL